MVKVHTILSQREQRKPLTVAYIRVSTKKEEQDGSFEAQKKYYENLIRSNPEWDFAGLYCEKASGTKLDDRPVIRVCARIISHFDLPSHPYTALASIADALASTQSAALYMRTNSASKFVNLFLHRP